MHRDQAVARMKAKSWHDAMPACHDEDVRRVRAEVEAVAWEKAAGVEQGRAGQSRARDGRQREGIIDVHGREGGRWPGDYKKTALMFSCELRDGAGRG